MERALISARQFRWLVINVGISTSSMVIPGLIIFYSKQSAWLAVLLSVAAAAAVMVLNVALAQRFPGQTLTQYAPRILGVWPGKLVGFFYALVFLMLTAACLRMIAQLWQIAVMPETPLAVFVAGLTLFAVYSAWLGLEVIARANDILLPFMLLVFAGLLLLAYPRGEWYHALPVRQIDPRGLAVGAAISFACLAEEFCLLFLAPSLERPAELPGASLRGLLAGGLTILVITQGILFVLGVYRASTYFFPLLLISEELSVLDIFERFEPFVLAAWLTINSLKIALFTYLFARTAAQTLQRTDHRRFLLAALLVMPPLAMMPRSLSELLHLWLETVAFQFVLPVAFVVLPGLLLAVAKVRKL